MFFRILIKYILGYINIKIEGYFVEKFINKCINENILSSSVAYCWRYCFLDIYRCLEPKFTYPCIKKLKSSLSLSHTSDIIDNSLYDILGWRVKEEGAMVDLFDCLPQILKTEFARIKKDDEADIIGKRIYKLRNSIVHHYSVENNIEDVIKELQTESLQTSTNTEKLQLNSRRYVVYDRNTRIKYIWKR